jgi:hypothetical protein
MTKIKTTLDDLFEKIDYRMVSTNKVENEQNNIALSYFKRYFRTIEDYEDFIKEHYVVVDDRFEEVLPWEIKAIGRIGQSRVLVFADAASFETRYNCRSYPVESNLMFRMLNPKLAPARVIHYYDYLDMTGPTDKQHLYVDFWLGWNVYDKVVYQDSNGNYDELFEWIPK